MVKLDKTRFEGYTRENWRDGKWQLSHSISSVKELDGIIKLSTEEYDAISKCLEKFSMSITPYFLSLIDWANENDPIKAQCIPHSSELVIEEWEKEDPLNEEEQSPVERLVHRYPDRVLLLASSKCAMYCRHCTRKRFAGSPCEKVITEKQSEACFEYIRNHTEVRDVIISGGDPLMLSNHMIEYLLANLREIPHVEIIRIGTRVPVVLPQRIDYALCNIIKRYHPVWMNIQVNHPNEITEEVKEACGRLADAGIPLGNQSVLLKGVNDNLETMKTLVHELVKMRVRPYYLYQCDLSYGLAHFRTPVSKGIEIIKGLRGFTSGFCIPQFVIDSPNGGGKVPINPDYITDWNKDKITFLNYEGDEYSYPEVQGGTNGTDR